MKKFFLIMILSIALNNNCAEKVVTSIGFDLTDQGMEQADDYDSSSTLIDWSNDYLDKLNEKEQKVIIACVKQYLLGSSKTFDEISERLSQNSKDVYEEAQRLIDELCISKLVFYKYLTLTYKS